MASSPDNISMAVFCDFENVALGVRDANYEKFDIKPVLERLLLKGSIVVKKSYCDWDRYKGFKATMHEANFELIEIPHVRQSGKNSADIRMVVDALDLCYTKSHVNTFVIVSGDSDFSPLVSKLRENAKRVIGVGVKQSTSDLLVANCDEFIFYDDLVREQRRAAAKRDERKAQPQQGRRPSDENNRKREDMEARKLQALEMVVETFDALVSERGDTGKIWASLLKDTLKRRRPDFSETYYGFRTFGNLLEEAQTRGLFEFGRDEKSGTYVFRGANAQVDLQPVDAAPLEPAVEQPQVASEPAAQEAGDELAAETQGEQPTEIPAAAREPRRRGGRGRKGREGQAPAPALEAVQDAVPVSEEAAIATWPAPTPDLAEAPEPVVAAEEPVGAAEDAPAPVKERRRATRAPRKRKEEAAGTAVTAEAVAQEDSAAALDAQAAVAEAAPAESVAAEGEDEEQGAKSARKKSARPSHKAPSRKPAARAPRRPAKPKTPPENG
ncbi:NYN domain protein [Massilia sp. Root133]|uniref:NYN domain-containing protein n=1 Tax=Massilia cellulosiltytica TaxID=2683234 RepID=A0A7X3KA80_9BURK|nr:MULTISPECIES: NYN domain-containing protein [Telluria group]KQX95528.1 NYN domain protein [Massilia sp. Root133]KQZ34787.1 NYN domain protein [Massilia sp. Root1485]MVW62746.1 NYN domain-containing protein [Telluria cellulosilytica]